MSHPRALCALAAGAALLGTPMPTIAGDDPAAPAATIGDAAVSPPTSRSGAASGTLLWLPGEQSLGRVARDGLVPQPSIELGGAGDGPVAVESVVATDEDVWAALPGEHALALLDAATGAEQRRVSLDAYPYALAADGDSLWVASFDDGQVLRVDRASGEVLATVEGLVGPTGIAIGEGSVWVVANGNGRLIQIDPDTANIAAQAILPGKPHSVAVGLGGVWTANGQAGTVSHFDPAAQELVATIALSGDAYDIEVVGDSVWVTTGTRGGCETTNAVIRIDPATDSVVDTLPFPCAWALITDGESLWVSGSDERGSLLAPIAIP